LPLYTFFLHDGPDTTPRFELEFLDGREEAESHASRLLEQRPHYSAVTIADGETEIGRLVRETSPS